MLVGAALAFTVAVVLVAAMTSVGAGSQSATACVATTGGPPSAEAQATIPADLLPLFAGAERAYGVPWNVLAAINKVETDFGRNLGPSPAGAIGWMQFEPATWLRYGRDADGDGYADPDDPADAIYSAAAYLRASGAPADMRGALFAYNHAGWYVDEVLALARRYADTTDAPGSPTSADEADATCALEPTASGGEVRTAPGADLPGRPITPETLAFLRRVAGIYGHPLIVTTGTNHSRYTVDGRVSDHADGHAADIGMAANGGSDDSPVGDRIMAACLIAAGESPDQALADAQRGGLYTLEHDGLRVQCIWKTDEGGNHHNHVHIGARPA